LQRRFTEGFEKKEIQRVLKRRRYRGL